MAVLTLTACFGGKSTTASGGELTGSSSRSFSEPAPYGMVLVKRGHLRMGMENMDTLWGKQTPVRDISVDGFWMDDTEITNSEYRQFVYYVRDSIIRERLADPNYGGDETYKIEEDKNGDPIKPQLNWKKPLPRKPTEDELRALESVYVTNPVTGEKMLFAINDGNYNVNILPNKIQARWVGTDRTGQYMTANAVTLTALSGGVYIEFGYDIGTVNQKTFKINLNGGKILMKASDVSMWPDESNIQIGDVFLGTDGCLRVRTS